MRKAITPEYIEARNAWEQAQARHDSLIARGAKFAVIRNASLLAYVAGLRMIGCAN